MRLRLLLALAPAAIAVAAGVTFADPSSDFNSVLADYRGTDGTAANDIVSCRWERQQLVNARNVGQTSSDLAYDPGFSSEAGAEIGRWDSGFCAGVAPNAAAGSNNPWGDYFAVIADWQADGAMTPCLFTRKQLVSALNVAAMVADFDLLAPGFREAVRQQIARIDRGKCRRGRLKVARIHARGQDGDAPSEYVVVKNVGDAAAKLGGMSLQDKQGHKIRFSRGTTLKRGRSLRIVSGCLAGRSAPARRPGRFYACRSRGVWNDKGDVVKVLDAAGSVVAQRGFGRFRGVPKF